MKLWMEIHVNDVTLVKNKNTPKYNTKDDEGRGQQKDEKLTMNDKKIIKNSMRVE
jgi:hypothetical protein